MRLLKTTKPERPAFLLLFLVVFISTGFLPQYLECSDYLDRSPIEHLEKDFESEDKENKTESATDDYTYEFTGQSASSRILKSSFTKQLHDWQSAVIDIHIPPPERASCSHSH